MKAECSGIPIKLEYNVRTDKTSKKKKKHYAQVHSKCWELDEAFMGWLCESAKSRYMSHCRCCEKDITANRYDIARHSKTQRHKKNVEKYEFILPSISSKDIIFKKPKEERKDWIDSCEDAFNDDPETIELELPDLEIEDAENQPTAYITKCKANQTPPVIIYSSPGKQIHSVIQTPPPPPPLPKEEAREDIFGRFVASQLSMIKDEQLYIETQWKIYNVVIEACREYLSRKSPLEKEPADILGASFRSVLS